MIETQNQCHFVASGADRHAGIDTFCRRQYPASGRSSDGGFYHINAGAVVFGITLILNLVMADNASPSPVEKVYIHNDDSGLNFEVEETLENGESKKTVIFTVNSL